MFIPPIPESAFCMLHERSGIPAYVGDSDERGWGERDTIWDNGAPTFLVPGRFLLMTISHYHHQHVHPWPPTPLSLQRNSTVLMQGVKQIAKKFLCVVLLISSEGSTRRITCCYMYDQRGYIYMNGFVSIPPIRHDLGISPIQETTGSATWHIKVDHGLFPWLYQLPE